MVRPTWDAEKIRQELRCMRPHSGGAVYLRDPKAELFLLAAANMAGRPTYYEGADTRERRFQRLIREQALTDPEWTVGLLRWLRGVGTMRTTSLIGAAEFVHARQQAGQHGHSRQAVSAVLQRADEPGEFLEYWTTHYGRRLPMPVKRGVADAVRRLYTGRALLKYDTASASFRFGDVLELTHPTPDPERPWQADVFRYALARRHHPKRATPPADSELFVAHHALMAVPTAERRAVVDAPDAAAVLAAAGMTWESLAGWLQGPLDAGAWEAVIPSMGAMALVRNLRNFDEAGIGEAATAEVVRRLCDRDEVVRSRQFPFRFLAAYRHADGARWSRALETALGHSLGNVPSLPGRTLVLVDRSGSMFFTTEGPTELTRADAAAVFGTALALRSEAADLVEFGTGSKRIKAGPRDSVLETVGRFTECGGTNTAAAVEAHYAGHDRVVIITDEQAYPSGRDILAPVPADVPVYTWNLVGYAFGHAAPGPRRYTFGGLSDAAFRLIPFIEAGGDGQWPWSPDALGPMPTG
ncbi:TROVE domain-containing protein [Catenulispora sp. GP43]|uniref:TROVE domain-containing protein n=1 Tax=Catenulispora sp. GP43 TaxID=3156263 RepID=UPI0035162DD8